MSKRTRIEVRSVTPHPEGGAIIRGVDHETRFKQFYCPNSLISTGLKGQMVEVIHQFSPNKYQVVESIQVLRQGTPKETSKLDVKALVEWAGERVDISISTLTGEVAGVCWTCWEDDRMRECPGGTHHHHDYVGGQMVHTAQMLEMAHALCELEATTLDASILIPAVLVHDWGKIWDYEEKEDRLVYTNHLKLVGHLPRSYAEWMIAARKGDVPESIQTEIGHCILAHHGRQDWGSPVLPQTAEAWALHHVDMMSRDCCPK